MGGVPTILQPIFKTERISCANDQMTVATTLSGYRHKLMEVEQGYKVFYINLELLQHGPYFQRCQKGN